ncbi:hypothetical protein G5B04_07230 [Fusicatenibacter saccharivorans]|uniref:hypothetical protein n=1 Tax=Fusicatenibacter saccharivorans TaxID=1150298 RepID=UPI0015707408|nr:hypothetical protein [Fusicatenibacter saccharivorans]NSF05620.1 hypothetical protein [Fusicatenibacter saccharivorans]
MKISGEMDFVIISPQVFSSLIAKIHNSPEREVAVVVEEIMPPGFMDYLINVINVNRFTNEKFRYHYILEDPITRKDLYKILKEQLSRADMDNTTCFQNISLQRTLHGAAELDMECNEPFFLACKDSTAKLVYTFQDGREETLVIEY